MLLKSSIFLMNQGNFLYSESLMLPFLCSLTRSLFIVQCKYECLTMGQEISVEAQPSGMQ